MITNQDNSSVSPTRDEAHPRDCSADSASFDCVNALTVIAALGVRFAVTITCDGEFVEICKEPGTCSTCKHSPLA